MSLYGVLRSGVSGMNAQSNKLGTVAENIQNANTSGYKRASTEFSSLILPSSEGNYNSGSVTTKVRYSIGDQGPVTYTTSTSDLAISGNGFFVVSDPKGSPYLTRAGNFVIDGPTGSLVNAAGFTLLGYSLAAGPAAASVNGLGDLVPINIASLGMQANASTEGTFTGNLPYGATLVPVSGEAPPYVSGARSTHLSISNLTRGDEIKVTVGTDPEQSFKVTTEASVDDLVTSINNAVTAGTLNGVQASKDLSTGKLVLTSLDPSGGTAVAGSFTDVTPINKKSSLQVYDNVGNSVKLDIDLTKTGANTWEISVYNGSSVLSGPAPLTFDANGQLSGASSLSFDIPNGERFTLDLKGMTQLAGEYSVTGSADGNKPSAVKDAEFASDGTVYAVYEDGTRVEAYKLALATVASPDNLAPRAGNVYEATSKSGDYMVGFAETGGFGTIQSSALEGSNVDIGTELTAMIEAQTSYTANSKVFQTGSELLDVLMNLKR